MRLKFKDYYDKVKGCYVGMNIGGTLGAPFECYRGVYDINWFMQDISEPIPNDDLDLQLVWLRACELEGRKIDSHTLAEYWNTYISATISEYGTGKNNFNMGIMPPLSGYMRNPNRDSNGAWIRSEIWACLCAGNPSLAVNYAYYDACVDHASEGVYAAAFIAAIQSAAFFESDIDELIKIGLSYIPEDSGVSKAVKEVINLYNNGYTWQETRKRLFQLVPSSFGNLAGLWKGSSEVPACKECPVQELDKEIPEAVHGYDAPWHVGGVIIGLLYGQGDFAKSVCISVNLGEDTDCTAGTVGAILGIINGESGIPDKWKNACSDKISTWTLRIDCNLNLPKNISQLVYRITRLTPEFLQNQCKLFSYNYGDNYTNISGENYYEIEPVQSFRYKENAFGQHIQEDSKELLNEQGNTVRKHFGLYNIIIKFDEDLVKITENKVKKLDIKFQNMLFTPQYLTVRFIDVPDGWILNHGRECCVGLEQWHGGSNDNSIMIEITPTSITSGKTTIVMEISTMGRMTKNYIPITFINGSC